MDLERRIAIIEGEGLKTVAEYTLHKLAESHLGRRAIEAYAFGLRGKIDDPALHTEIGGLPLVNPLLVGAGWDKKGWAVNGLYELGYAGTEVGTVTFFGQPGSMKPRLETVNRKKSVGRNWLGFNSHGAEAVDRQLDSLGEKQGIVGINLGLNKMMPHERSPWAHAAALTHLYLHADYFVFNPASPNTPNLRELQRQDALRAHIQALKDAMDKAGGQKPLFIKLSPDSDIEVFDGAIEATIEEEATGLILANTTTNNLIKRMYDLEGKPGGISGDSAVYRAIVLSMIFRAYEQAGDKIEIIGVGGINKPEHALDYILAGATAVQQVTAIRQTWGRSAATINRGLSEWMRAHRVESIKQLIGAATLRGAKYPSAA